MMPSPAMTSHIKVGNDRDGMLTTLVGGGRCGLGRNGRRNQRNGRRDNQCVFLHVASSAVNLHQTPTTMAQATHRSAVPGAWPASSRRACL